MLPGLQHQAVWTAAEADWLFVVLRHHSCDVHHGEPCSELVPLHLSTLR